jgi:hypothetical protein
MKKEDYTKQAAYFAATYTATRVTMAGKKLHEIPRAAYDKFVLEYEKSLKDYTKQAEEDANAAIASAIKTHNYAIATKHYAPKGTCDKEKWGKLAEAMEHDLYIPISPIHTVRERTNAFNTLVAQHVKPAGIGPVVALCLKTLATRNMALYTSGVTLGYYSIKSSKMVNGSPKPGRAYHSVATISFDVPLGKRVPQPHYKPLPIQVPKAIYGTYPSPLAAPASIQLISPFTAGYKSDSYRTDAKGKPLEALESVAKASCGSENKRNYQAGMLLAMRYIFDDPDLFNALKTVKPEELLKHLLKGTGVDQTALADLDKKYQSQLTDILDTRVVIDNNAIIAAAAEPTQITIGEDPTSTTLKAATIDDDDTTL